MTAEEAAVAFAKLSMELQTRVLVAYAADLTIVARGTYVGGTEDVANPPRLRLLNEVQHRILSQIEKLLTNDPNRYPDDVLVRTIICEKDAELLSRLSVVLAKF